MAAVLAPGVTLVRCSRRDRAHRLRLLVLRQRLEPRGERVARARGDRTRRATLRREPGSRPVTPTPRAIVFDLDGTLIDSSRDIAAAVNHALARAGLAALSIGQVKRFVGDGAGPLVARASGFDQHDARFGPLLADFLDYYTA